MTGPTSTKSALVIGASRGLGLALATEYVHRGWQVVGTVRGSAHTELHDAAASSGGRLLVEQVDIAVPDQVVALHDRMAGTRFDLLFVNAGATNGDVTVTEVSTETFNHLMVTNALSPMRVIETFADVVPPAGTIGVMSSRQGSIALNDTAGYEVYRASKSALNQLMRSFAARHSDDPRTLFLISPGHVQTELGGPSAPLTIGASIPAVVDTTSAQAFPPSSTRSRHTPAKAACTSSIGATAPSPGERPRARRAPHMDPAPGHLRGAKRLVVGAWTHGGGMSSELPRANLITLGARDFEALRDFYRRVGWPQVMDDRRVRRLRTAEPSS